MKKKLLSLLALILIAALPFFGAAEGVSDSVDVTIDDVFELPQEQEEIPEDVGEPEIAVEEAVAPEEAPSGSETPDEAAILTGGDVGFEVAATQLTLGVGEKRPVGVTFPDGGEYEIRYKSSDKGRATVAADGVITAKKTGKAEIAVRTPFGTKKIAVTVKKAPKSVSLSKTSRTLGVGESFSLTAKLPSGAAGSVTFESDDAAVVAVEEVSGKTVKLTAVGIGTAKVTAKTYNGKKKACTVTVKKAPEDGDLSIVAPDGIGLKEKISVTVEKGETAGALGFASSDPAIFKIDEKSGALTALGMGDAEIIVTAYNGATARKAVHVGSAPAGVKLAKASLAMSEGDSLRIEGVTVSGEDACCSSFKYSSSKTKVATVSKAGVIKAKKNGSATITVKSYNGKTAKIKLTVKKPLKSIAFKQKKLTLYIGGSATPGIKFSNGVTSRYSLKSSDPEIVKVLEDGHGIEALAPGDVKITAKSYNGKTAKLSVHVLKAPTGLALSPDNFTLGAGDTLALETLFNEDEGSAIEYTADGDVSVDGAGCVTALAAGHGTVTATASNGVSAQAEIDVLEAPTDLLLNMHDVRRALEEESLKLSLSFGGSGEGGRVSFTSSNKKVATVDDDGLVRFVGKGSTVITAKSYNGLRDSCSIEICEPPTGMSFDEEPLSIALGDRIQLEPAFEGGAESYALESDDNCIACDGSFIKAVAEGSAVVTATSLSGLQSSRTVNVVPAPTGIELNKAELTLMRGINASETLTPIIEGETGSVRFRSSDESIATVDRAGTVCVAGFGSCTITATTYNGHSASCQVTTHGVLEGAKIGIDPGHQRKGDSHTESSKPSGGSSKPRVSDGTSGKKTHIAEFRTVLTIGLKLRDVLEYYGAEVVMTRTTHDVNISNKQRAKMMNAANVDLWLRLHTDGVGSSGPHGTGIYIRKTMDYTKKQLPNGATILKREKNLASIMLNEMCAVTKFAKWGVKRTDNYTGNNWSKVPCLMVEMGFSSNKTDDVRLNKASYQNKFAQGMANGIGAYLAKYFPERGFVKPTEAYPVS